MDRPRPGVPTRCPNRGLSSGRADGRSPLLAALSASAASLATASYGVEAGEKTVAMIGLAATAMVAVAATLFANRSIRTRDDLRAANAELRRRNTDIEARYRTVAYGLDVVDGRTRGRLWELLEEAGDELAELADEALDERDGNAG